MIQPGGVGLIDRPMICKPARAGWCVNRDVEAEPLQVEGIHESANHTKRKFDKSRKFVEKSIKLIFHPTFKDCK